MSQTKPPTPPKPETLTREARLAKALRDNLRRRKAVMASRPKEPEKD